MFLIVRVPKKRVLSIIFKILMISKKNMNSKTNLMILIILIILSNHQNFNITQHFLYLTNLNNIQNLIIIILMNFKKIKIVMKKVNSNHWNFKKNTRPKKKIKINLKILITIWMKKLNLKIINLRKSFINFENQKEKSINKILYLIKKLNLMIRRWILKTSMTLEVFLHKKIL